MIKSDNARLYQAKALAILCRKPVLLAVMVGAVSQAVMVLFMAPTPVAMIGQGLNETVAGDVIRWHVVAMFASSYFTGFLIKKFGTKPVVRAGAIVASYGWLLTSNSTFSTPSNI